MAPNIPTVVPASITAGDSLQWIREFNDYSPVDGWALSYTLVSSTKAFNFNATAEGSAFNVSVPGSTTSGWPAGTYRIVEVLTNGSQRVTLNTWTLIVVADLTQAGADAGMDTRTHAEKMLANIEAWLESRAPTAGATEINGRRIQYYPLQELLALRDRYKRMVQAEQAGDGIVKGIRILVRL